MKKKLSAYWWCQIIGWGAFILTGTILYFLKSAAASFPSYSSIVVTGVLGLLTSHLMRLFIIKTHVLEKKIWKQFIYLFLIAITFSFIYFIFQLCEELIRSPKIFAEEYKTWSIAGNVFTNFNFLIVWIFIYFSFHYIQKSRSHLIDTIRLESELKIQQLESEKAQIEYQRNLGNYYLMALRYQMNPHFIFNCLNSIKLYTTQNDTEAASEYLTKFSKLIRLVMENSSKGKILLSTEIDMLHLYIDLEAMRFKEKLQYNICVEKDVEADYIELPPLLLQPYVENAIWHGLMYKEEGGRLDIHVALNEATSILLIAITDNGIGRKKSAEMKSKTAAKHTSYGMKVTSERIALINQVYKTGAEVKIEDLFDADRNAAGTKVIIQIPV